MNVLAPNIRQTDVSDDDPVSAIEGLAARSVRNDVSAEELISIGIGYLGNLKIFGVGAFLVGFVTGGAWIFLDPTPERRSALRTDIVEEPKLRIPLAAREVVLDGAGGEDDSALVVAPQVGEIPMPVTDLRVE
jgi:hypothetical protein